MDSLIKNGWIIDSTSNPWFYSDILLSVGEIAPEDGNPLGVRAGKMLLKQP
tara:strand:- start:25 stop:177 length:153 start_codon:yes stop_codon:yes gene_type:complete